MKTTMLLVRALLALVLLSALSAYPQEYPSKALHLIIPNPPGGGTDILGRLIANSLHTKLGQPVIVENRAGAGGNIAAEYVYKANPDGYTLFLSHHGPLIFSKMLYKKLAYDPELFTPISLVATLANILIVNPGMAANNVQQLIAFAKANPGRLNYGSSLNGPSHLTAEMFNAMARVGVVGVRYQGNGPAAMAVVAGQVDMMFVEISTALPHIRAGKLRVLAVADQKRNVLLPDVPTMSESLPGFASTNMYGVVAPPKTPSSVTDKVSLAIAEALRQPDAAKRLLDMSYEPIGSSPAELAQFMREERKRWAEVVRSSGAAAD